MEQKQFLQDNGYVVIKDFLSQDEVETLRKLCLSENFQKNTSVIMGDLITHKGFRDIIFTDKLINLLKKLVGEDIFYICDGTARGNDLPLTKEARKFHSDSRADDFNFSNEYPIYRLGIYLQDTDFYSGGLKVRRGSHKRLCVDHGRFFEGFYRFVKYFQRYKAIPPIAFSSGRNISLKAGELVIWNMRLHHSGHAVRLKAFPRLSFPPFIENYIPKNWILDPQKSRCVCFFSFGKKSEYMEDYYQYIKEHPDNISHWKNSDFLSPDLTSLLKTLSFSLIVNHEMDFDVTSYKAKKFF